jgi:L-aspartate oxidase
MSPHKHVLVVGSGIAGLIAAIELSQKHAVTLVTKAALSESNTRWAQGGIAAAMFSDDSIANHIADTLHAGAGLCNPDAVNVLCSEGPDRIRDLIRLGVTFDQSEDGHLAKGLEAAHSYPRVLHAGGDATGLTIETALVRAVRSRPNISVLEHTFALDLILSARDPNSACGPNEAGSVTGLKIIDASGEPHTIEADAVILASGGAGQLFLHTTNPSVATGDGVAIALRAGAQLADIEFYQFHPTALPSPPQSGSLDPPQIHPLDPPQICHLDRSAQRAVERPAVQTATAPPTGTFLISEAVRGEGAVLLDNHGRRFMQHIHPSAELAPRDIVARGIAHQMAAQNGQPVFLDATHLNAKHGVDFLTRRFPSIDAATRARNLDWARDPIAVTPAAHYWMGGVRTDLWGRTSVPGLYAVGEVACTGVHGANRLASNSLLESLTFAWRCAHLLLDESALTTQNTLSSRPESASFADIVERSLHSAGTTTIPSGSTQPVTRLDLQTLLWNNVGIERNAADLQAAAAQLNAWHAEGTTIYALETANLLALARVIVAAALAREESRGAHFRTDFPEPSTNFQHSLIYQQSEVQLPSPPKSGCPGSGLSDPGSQNAKQAIPC